MNERAKREEAGSRGVDPDVARRLAVAFLGAVMFWGLSAGPAAAHSSDFDTLTVDFLVGSRGLEAIDAAVVVSDSTPYETVEPAVRADIARQLLALLGVQAESADIDAEDSERYHWVGFVIRFPRPVLGATTPIEIDTAHLQALAADLGLAFLKISVCGVSGGPEYSHPSMGAFERLEIEASEEGRRPTGFDREFCEVWRLQPGDEALSINVQPAALPATGTSLTPTMPLAAVLITCGLVLLTARRPDRAQ
jgi:hypothetical protein